MEAKFGSIEKAVKEGSKEAKGVKDFEILEETITGEQATARVKTSFVDGTTREDNIPLIKENGVWKVEP